MSIHLDPQSLKSTQAPSSPIIPTRPPQPIEARPLTRAGFLRAAGSLLRTSGFVTVGLALSVFALERLAAPSWKPSSMLGAFGGNQESAHLLTAIEAKRALFAAEQGEIARAQQETLVIQANNERVTKAYEALFQRGNLLAQQWAEGAKQTLILDTQAKMQAMAGRAEVSARKDEWAFWCDVGEILLQTPDCGTGLRASAKSDRSAMSAEIITNFKEQSTLIASSLKDWSQGLPDPAELVAYKGQIDKLYPAPRPPAPLPPQGVAAALATAS